MASRILVADDDGALVDLVRLVLERDGHEVMAARDGAEAYEIVQRHDFHLSR